jgi:hypothetical protein
MIDCNPRGHRDARTPLPNRPASKQRTDDSLRHDSRQRSSDSALVWIEVQREREWSRMVMSRSRWVSIALAGVLLVQGDTRGEARGFASADAARDLVYALEPLGLSAIATADPAEPGTFVAALYIPRSQLLVVSARHPSVEGVAERIANHQYGQVYLDLYGSPDRRDKFFVQDSGADGILSALPGSGDVDVLYENGVRQTLFNGDAASQHLTESQYDEKWAIADNRYARLLTLLKSALDESAIVSRDRTDQRHQPGDLQAGLGSGVVRESFPGTRSADRSR